MNRPLPRAELEKFTAALAEKRRRLAKAEHSTRGYRDEDGVWRGGLLSFVRYFWHVLEPGTAFTEGMPVEAICQHLEAVTFGEITNLLINVPPGCCKSLLTNVYWPAWEWGAMELEHIRYVTFSYSASNTERDNQRFGDLVSCSDYQAMYPHVEIRQKGFEMVSNRKHGWKWASSVTGSATGKRGNRAICFPADQLVQTEFGSVPIGEIVDGLLQMRVPSIDIRTGEVSMQPVVGWHRNPGSEIVKITLSDGSSVRCTPNHKIWDGMQWVEASRLRTGTALPVVTGADVVSNLAPGSAYANALNSHSFYAVTRRQYGCGFSSVQSDLSDLILGEDCKSPRRQKRSMLESVVNVVLARSVFQIIRKWLHSVAIFVTNFVASNAWANERLCDQLVNQSVQRFPIEPQSNARIPLNDSPSHDFAGHKHFVAGSDDNSRQAFNAAKVRDLVQPLESNHRAPFLVVESVDFDGQVDISYCLTVEQNHTFLVGSRQGLIVSNCDDLNNVKESESATVLNETNRWFRESLSSRLNNMETDAKVVIAQRVAEADVSGEILALGLPYCHLMIPMEYEWQADPDGNPYTTDIGWVDPRWRPNPDDCNGVLAWPERFSESSVRSLKIELGEYAVAAQLQQIPAPRSGGIIQRDDWLPAEQYMDGSKFPPFSLVLGSLDGAFDEKESSDYSALTMWGIFQNENGYNRAMLIHAWQKRLPISGPKMEIEPGEHELMFKRRCMPTWGLVEWVADTCNRFKCDRLLIENKASGKPAAQTLQNSHGRQGWGIVLVEPKGDKYARGLAVQPSFSQGMIYAPDREWATADGFVIDQCAKFPKAKHDDLYDSTTQAIKHLRDNGLLRSDEERRAEEIEAVRHKGAPKGALYPGFRSRQAR